MAKRTSFNWSDECEPHKLRTKKIITEHPEIRNLIGRNPYTFLVILLCVSIQFALAFVLKDQAWGWSIAAAYLIGAFACHTLHVCIHECSHNLIFKNRTLNTISSIIANLPMVVPTAVSFTKYHIKHHAYQGVEELDADMPYRWEAKLINNSTLGKAVWLLFYPIFQAIRPARLKEIQLWDAWTIVNLVVQIGVSVAVFYFLGIKALVFLTLSLFFSVGLHPLGARWVQEHFLTHGDHQETKSYYGRLNVPNLNVGFHNEHHDFPSVPWNKLPEIKKLAGKHYDDLGYHTSYTKLLLEFLFSRELSIYSRTARSNRGKKASEMKPVAIPVTNNEIAQRVSA
ncbi:fatty acid desaturase [Mucilaginibacter sp. RS28]|uniref:Fatty acid desaturase n=1 Tax=Mucilaginibacter straminoryzae TaxID=2932774 RepID=A0A9X1X3U1_9SPHI|nr:fatty acid desaturase [Mucilaginibacter straminoryzae]MCJ8210458.1 fatty acid desaturase [Mucilaginibacter straminoryzae]